MRPIEFRAWDKIDGVMRDWGNLCSHRYGAKGETIFSDPQYILMQYTGLKDRNGVDVFEGDILRASIYCDEDAQILAVKYAGSGFIIEYKDAEADYFMLSDFPGSIEVIGNIWEHPERLK